MTLMIPVKLKMNINPFKQVETCPQRFQNDENALDNVVDALTEFNVSSEEESRSPEKSYDLERKRSSMSLYTRLDYFIDHNELPRVHRSPSNQSLLSEKVLSKNNKTTFEKYETGSNNSFNSTSFQSSFISSASDFDDHKPSELENKIGELKNRLQEKEIENNQLRFALKDIEWKTELKWQEKYQEILRQNANYEGQLKTLKNQYEKLKETSQPAKNNIVEEYTNLQSKLNYFEKSNSELASKLILATNEASQLQKHSTNLESENEKLRIEVQELKIELDSKNSILQSLKNKITELHIEHQNQIQANNKLKNQISSLAYEVESVKKSEKWYSKQLHGCQLQKNKIQQELMSIQMHIVASSTKIDKLKNEVVFYKNISEENKIKAMKEKEKLLKRMEAIEADLIERQVINGEKIIISKKNEDFVDKIILEESQERITTLLKTIEEKNDFITQLNKQGANFLVRVTTIQKLLNEKELNIQTLENLNKDLEMKTTGLKDVLNEKEAQIFELKNKVIDLEVQLDASNNEKNEVDTAVKTIRDDFNKFMKVYNNMKVQLEEKSKTIADFECAKNKQSTQNEHNLKLREILNTRETQLLNQTENCDLLNKEIVEQAHHINALKQEVESLTLQLHNANFKISELRDINMSLEIKIQGLYKKIRDNNLVIDQFNYLCRNSELEKRDLLKKLENFSDSLANFTSNDCSVQVDVYNFDENIKTIKEILNEIILENNNQNFDLNSLNSDNFFTLIPKFLTYFVQSSKQLQNEVMLLKSETSEKILGIEKRFGLVQKSVDDSSEQLRFIKELLEKKNGCAKFVQTEDNGIEMKFQNGADEIPTSKNKNKYDKTNRTLLRKLKDELKSRKTAEKNLQVIQGTYTLALSEINNLKIESNRLNLEYETLKERCNEYKQICDKQNEKILNFEKEIGATNSRSIECTNCLELKKLKNVHIELDCRFNALKEKLVWYEKEMNDKEKGITECRKQLFNEKIHTSALKKQVSSIQMCLDNANSLLDTKQVELSQLKSVCDKLEKSKCELSDSLEMEQANCRELKQKFDETSRLLDEKIAKDEILADEIKTLSCHLHQKNLELSNSEGRMLALQEEHKKKINLLEKSIEELGNNLAETQLELEGIRNDKFFLQRLCADLKTSLQATMNQNKVSQECLNLLQTDSLPTSKIDDEYIYKLLKESTVSPEKPLLNLRSCLDSLKKEMAILQSEIIAKTQNNF